MKWMRQMILAGVVVSMLALAGNGRADDWVQVPSGGDAGAETAAPSPGGDRQAIEDFLAHVRSSRGDAGQMCQLIAMMADAAAVIRDQGASKKSQLATTDGSLNKTADERHIPRELIQPIESVVNREIAYAYAHPSMSADAVKAHWAGMCAAN